VFKIDLEILYDLWGRTFQRFNAILGIVGVIGAYATNGQVIPGTF